MSLSISPDGQFALGVSSDSRLSLFSTVDASKAPQSFSERSHLASQYTTGACWCPLDTPGAGRLVALGTGGGSVVVWDVSRGEISSRLGGPSESGGSEGAAAVAGSGGKRRHRESSGGKSSGFTGPVRGLWWSDSAGAATGEEGEEGEEGTPPLYACAEGSSQVHGWRLGKDGKSNSSSSSNSSGALPPSIVLKGGEKGGNQRVAFAAGAGEDSGVVFAAGTGTIYALDASPGGRRVATLAGFPLPTTGLFISEDQVSFFSFLGALVLLCVCVWCVWCVATLCTALHLGQADAPRVT